MSGSVDNPDWQPEARIHVPALDRELPLLMDVKDAGQLAGLSRFAAYRAVNEGVMPSIQMGERRVLVPTATWLEKLGLRYQSVSQAAAAVDRKQLDRLLRASCKGILRAADEDEDRARRSGMRAATLAFLDILDDIEAGKS